MCNITVVELRRDRDETSSGIKSFTEQHYLSTTRRHPNPTHYAKYTKTYKDGTNKAEQWFIHCEQHPDTRSDPATSESGYFTWIQGVTGADSQER